MIASSISDKLLAARRRQFVGRNDEVALFRAWLQTDNPDFVVLFIYGPGGVGKTSLLNELISHCSPSDFQIIRLDARSIEPTPAAFINALGQASGLPEGSVRTGTVAHVFTRPTVMVIDTYETLGPLDNWIREEFLPQLPQHTRVVIAGRDMLPTDWLADPGWQSITRVVPLRNLKPAESRQFLARKNIPEEEHDSVLEFTHGHPLALSLIADTFAQRGSFHLQQDDTFNIVAKLTEQFLQKVPSPAHRSALEVCSVVRLLTESLLSAMMGMLDVHELFNWLRSLSFIESNEFGVFPHDLARDTLTSDVRWRNPDWFAALHKRARDYYNRRLHDSVGMAQQQVVLDYIYLHRDNPAVRPFFEWKNSPGYISDQAGPGDVEPVLEIIRAHEGEQSAQFAKLWLNRPEASAMVFRNSAMEPDGLMMMINLAMIRDDDCLNDPAVVSARNYLRAVAPLRTGERATLFRFWMARDSYQSISPIQSLIFTQAVLHYLVTQGLAYTFFPCSDPDMWAMVFAYADLERIPQADFSVDGKGFGMYGHDWRTTPPSAWLALLAERELAIMSTQPADTKPKGSVPIVVLSRPEFEAWVKSALKNFSDDPALRANPLLRSRMVVEKAGAGSDESERLRWLKDIMLDAVSGMESAPKGEKPARVLRKTYITPASSQERAAELLGLPFSTYRRHLAHGIERLTQILWNAEVGT